MIHVDCVSGNGKIKHFTFLSRVDADRVVADYRSRTGNGGWNVRVYLADGDCPFCVAATLPYPRRVA